ncbi:hypothetical protein HOY80DRAFT_955227 [Tuber brumale]|nr:hypothetical protein HOY80DRAFT_955227 [Tuber brumale]
MSPSSSLASAFKAFAFAFMYHSLCEFFFSNANTLPVALLWLTSFPLLTTYTFLPDGLAERSLAVFPDVAFDYLLGDLVAAYEDRPVIPAPAPIPIPPPTQLHTIPLSVVIANLSCPATPPPATLPPPVRPKAVDILPAWYPASFPLSPAPDPPAVFPPARVPCRKVRICCLPGIEK